MKLKIKDLQPSQLFLSLKKMQRIEDWMAGDDFEPIVVGKFPNSERTVIIDGHTRTFCAFRCGIKEIEVIFEEEIATDLCFLYQKCIEWCKSSQIISIEDLSDKILSEESYFVEWIERCQKELLKIRNSQVP